MCLGLALSFGAGVAINSLTMNVPAQADSISKSGTDDIYRELDAGGSSLAETSKVMAKIAKVVTPSVVHIQSVKQYPGRGKLEETGSGVIMTSPKRPGVYVITNRHVINHSLQELNGISIHLHDGRVLKPVRVWDDRYSDIAVLELGTNDLPSLRWGDSDKLEIGNVVLTCGSPFGLSQSVTMGIISARGRRALKGQNTGVLNQDFLQTDAAINPGNSGGPLVDLQGRLIGINTAIASTHGGNEGIGFSIPSNLVRLVAEHLLEFGEVRRAYLGVKLDDEFSFEKAQQLNLSRVRGARVLEVYPNTPAQRAKLQYNDVVMQFEGKEILDESHLINLVSLSPVGRKYEVLVWRNADAVKLIVDLTGRPGGTAE
jgi:serine protease Do